MSRTIQRSLPPMELNKVQHATEPVQRSTEHRTELVPSEVQWRGFVTTAAAKAQLSGKDLCYHLGIGKSQLSGQLNGAPNQHLSFWRCRALPREFWQEFVTLLIAFYDLSVGADPQTQRYAEIGRRVCETQALVEASRR